jgi:hypothetical protein
MINGKQQDLSQFVTKPLATPYFFRRETKKPTKLELSIMRSRINIRRKLNAKPNK